jgi:hypothetical protein
MVIQNSVHARPMPLSYVSMDPCGVPFSFRTGTCLGAILRYLHMKPGYNRHRNQSLNYLQRLYEQCLLWQRRSGVRSVVDPHLQRCRKLTAPTRTSIWPIMTTHRRPKISLSAPAMAKETAAPMDQPPGIHAMSSRPSSDMPI